MSILLDLDTIGALEGTDKSSSVTNSWDYLRHYDHLFSRWKDEPINFLEIGVEKGPSLGVWLNYFSKAQIVGMDIDPDCAALARDRVAIEIGSQADADFLRETCEKYPPTIIIDDGSHRADHIVFTFEQMFPMLAPGGIYVIEDMAFHFEPHSAYHVEGVSPMDYFNAISQSRLARDSRNDAKLSDVHAYIRDNVDSIAYVSGAIVIAKLAPFMLADRSTCEQYIRMRGLGSAGRVRLANHIAHHLGPRADVMQLLDEIPHHARDIDYFMTLANYLHSIGEWDSEKAESVVREGLDRFPNSYDLAWRLGHILLEHHDFDGAVTWLKRAAEACPNQRRVLIYEMLGTAYERQGQSKKATEALGQAVKHGAIGEHQRELESRIAALI